MLDQFRSDLRYRLRALFDRDAVERELDDEVRLHLEREAEKYERMGLPRSDALRRARLAFGGVDRAKEQSRDNRGTALLESTLQDLRYAARGLRAKPGFTLGIVLTLGLGIGANAAMFGIVDRLLFRPPPFLSAPALVNRYYETATYDTRESTYGDVGFARYLDLARSTHSFSTVAVFASPQTAIGDGDNVRQRRVTAASAGFFDLFDVHPAVGRFFTADDDRLPTGSPVVILGYEFWQTQYGGRADVLGTTLRVGRTICTIIGVAPAGFVGVAEDQVPALFLPITTYAWDTRGADLRKGYDYASSYDWHWFEIVARRQPGVSVESATADVDVALRQSWIKQLESGKSKRSLASLRPHAMLAPIQVDRGPEAGPEAKVTIWVSGVAFIVLLIACANVANLLLARAIIRRREIALRLALGVSRGRLVRQLLTESVLLALLGGCAGIATAQWGGRVLRALFLPPDFAAAGVADTRTLAVAIGATLTAALLTALAPVVQTLRYEGLSHVLSGGGREAGVRRSRMRTALLVFQATLSFVLLAGAGLFVRSLYNVRAMRLGFDVSPVLTVTNLMRGTALTDMEKVALERRLTEEARTIPGVVAATPSPSVPFWGFEERALFVPGIDSVDRLGNFILQAGNADFFRTFGTRMLRGRAFDDRDDANAPRVVVVSDGMANALWPGRDPVGKCIRISADTAPCTTVIGIAEEMRINQLQDPATGPRSYTYFLPISQYDHPAGMLMVRVGGNADAYAETIRKRLQRVMPGASYVITRPLENMVDQRTQSWRLGATMFLAFASLALVIAGVGLYSVIAYGVAQRRQEIGVRIALGASRSHVVRLVVQGGLQLVVGGIVAGVILSLWASRWVASLMFQESPTDPIVYAAVAVTLAAVAVTASMIPAIGASRVDPNVALRAE